MVWYKSIDVNRFFFYYSSFIPKYIYIDLLSWRSYLLSSWTEGISSNVNAITTAALAHAEKNGMTETAAAGDVTTTQPTTKSKQGFRRAKFHYRIG